MARHKKYRRNSNFQAITVDVNLVLSTLADAGVIKAQLSALGVTRFKVVSADLMWTIGGLTALEGPIVVGITSSDLSAAEVKESLDANPTSQSDIIAIEQGKRPVRRSGVFHGLNTDEVLNNGRPIRTKMVTILDEGKELEAWARNTSGATLTTGATVHCFGTMYGYWI